MTNEETSYPSYEDARRDALARAHTVRILGVPLDGTSSETHIAILWCGIAVDGAEHRQGTHRIWHLRKADLVASGIVDDFEFNGNRVNFYDLDRDSDPVEETYSSVSLSHTLRLFFGSVLGDAPLEALASGLIKNPVPLTISPTPTISPTGTPPITILP